MGSLAALRRGVAEARSRDVGLIAVLAWMPPGGNGMGRRAPCPPVLLAEWQRAALHRLRTAWDDAMGGVPSDLNVRLLAIRGPVGEALLGVADRGSDLLVIGAGRRTVVRRVFGRSVAGHCAMRAECDVLVVPPPAMARQIRPRARRRLVRELITGQPAR